MQALTNRMTRVLLILQLLFCSYFSFAQKDLTSLVNPFIGTGGHGHTYPGASMPFGMMQLSPDTRMADWDGSSGYHYSDSVIYGFSHTHLSGTGIPDYCDLLFMPFTGNVAWHNKDYRSTFSHRNEKASPGYYEVLLDKHHIKAQLTTALRSGMHQYTYPVAAKEGSILIDLNHRDEVIESWIRKLSDHELCGLRRSKSWAQDQWVYFYIRFEKPIREFTVLDDEGHEVHDTLVKGKHLKAFVRFTLDGTKTVRAKVGISGVSTDGARANLDSEIRDWNFEALHKKSVQAWNKELNCINIKGGTHDQQVCFYTALYHTFLVPNIYEDVDGQYRGTDHKVHHAEGFTNYSVFSLWDTYRAYNPLMTIINRRRTLDWINTFLAQYRQGGMLPVWELSGNETFCMIGYHSVPVIVNAYRNGIRGFDADLALKAMRSYAESDRFGLSFYRTQGYIGNEQEHESASKTVEYAYDDWCIAQLAKSLHNDTVYAQYIRRAQDYKNLFDPETHNLRGKVRAQWYHPFDAKEINNFYTEGNAWQYSFTVPQDLETLIQLHGGCEAFAGKLEEMFTTTSRTTGRDQADVTGLIGQYAQGNEPSHHIAYLFAYAGKPWRTQELVHRICTEFYTNTPAGLIGNEDCGQMSAWYILSALGFYPVCPGSGSYIMGTPLFEEATIRMENGKTFTIRAQGGGPYVNSTDLNGHSYKKNYLLHEDLMAGGALNFHLSDQPNKMRGITTASLPSSRIGDELIVPVPYVDVVSNKFKDSLQVVLGDIDPQAKIYYRMGDEKERSYEAPFLIRSNVEIQFYAKRGSERSKTVSQPFYRLPTDRSITILSEVNPMYTGGGPEALIDGIEGTTNWRADDWQSYFGKDFEAVIDLQSVRPVHHLGIHVLQEVSPWILYPKEVIFFTSNDGKTFTEAARIRNQVDQKPGPAELQELGADVTLNARYIRIKAINGGQLPAWHESAGNPSHLFIDEVLVR
jgi:predicted alpha-1,2-mannosidase